jgi:hypothetical protein
MENILNYPSLVQLLENPRSIKCDDEDDIDLLFPEDLEHYMALVAVVVVADSQRRILSFLALLLLFSFCWWLVQQEAEQKRRRLHAQILSMRILWTVARAQSRGLLLLLLGTLMLLSSLKPS